MGGDNVYMVTVMADDGTYMATRNVVVTVTDVEDDAPVIDDPVALYDSGETTTAGLTRTNW